VSARCVWAETSWVEFDAEGIFATGPFWEGISLVETVGGTFLLTFGSRMEIRCSPNVEGIWNVTGWGSLLFCYILRREIAELGRLDVLAPDPSAGGSVPRLTTFVVEPCGSGC
jgi:hypothetical protein